MEGFLVVDNEVFLNFGGKDVDLVDFFWLDGGVVDEDIEVFVLKDICLEFFFEKFYYYFELYLF